VRGTRLPDKHLSFNNLTKPPDKLVVRELWDDQAALDTHAQRNATRPAAALGAGGPPR
jgi:quinol monooxygenase YgiN